MVSSQHDTSHTTATIPPCTIPKKAKTSSTRSVISNPSRSSPSHQITQRTLIPCRIASQNPTPKPLDPIHSRLRNRPLHLSPPNRRHIRLLIRRTPPRAFPIHHLANRNSEHPSAQCRCAQFLGYHLRSAIVWPRC